MIPASFEYFAPKTFSEAIALLQKHGPDAKILAGGQSLIPLMKLRMASPKRLIDLNHVSGLSYIKEVDGYLTIGALTRESELDSSDLIRDHGALDGRAVVPRPARYSLRSSRFGRISAGIAVAPIGRYSTSNEPR